MTKILINLGSFASLMVVAIVGNAALSCKDVTFSNSNYFYNMEKLAIEARLSDGYFNRYHESIVSDLCDNKDSKDIEWAVETGYVPRSEVQSIKEVLGLDKQYLRGLRYQSIRERFVKMGVASAGAGNATDAYIYKPNSKCGKLEGVQNSVSTKLKTHHRI